MKISLLLILNLTTCISCLVISGLIIIFGSIMIVEPNIYIVVAELILSSITFVLNIKSLMSNP